MPRYRRILVPIDFSEQSRGALRYAAELARAFGASLDVLYAWDPPGFIPPHMVVEMASSPHGERPLSELARQRIDEDMQALLDELSADAELDARGLLEIDSPGASILRVARNEGHDVIVLATHGREGLSRVFMGSIAERVVRLAPCPVLVWREPAASE